MLKKTPAPVSTCLCCWKGCSCPSCLPLPLSLPLLPLLPAPSQPTGSSPAVLPARLAKKVPPFTKVSDLLFSSLFISWF